MEILKASQNVAKKKKKPKESHAGRIKIGCHLQTSMDLLFPSRKWMRLTTLFKRRTASTSTVDGG